MDQFGIKDDYFDLDFAFQINFRRSLLESDISDWKNKRMTGFHAEWHLVYRNGTHINVSQPPLFTLGHNKLFREFMSMLNSSISSGKITAESAMEKLKHLKKDWIVRNREKLDEKCSYYVSGSPQESRKMWENVFETHSGLALKIEELEQIFSEYSDEMEYKDSATEKREGDLKIIELSIYNTKQHYYDVGALSEVFRCVSISISATFTEIHILSFV